MERFDMDFTVHTGDIVSDGEQQGLWDEYFEDTEVINGYKQGFFIEGNHENGLITKMYDNIPLPSNGRDSRYYSFNWGPLGFVGLNTNNQEVWPNEKMPVTWLDAELSKFERDKYTLWKFAYMHHPIFNSQEGRSDLGELIPTWCPIFEKYNVDVIFAGHNHYYERTYPMNHLKEFDDSSEHHFTNPEYPIYMIAAGAGAPLYDRSEGNQEYNAPAYAATYNSTYHFVLVDIDINTANEQTTLTLEAWGMPVIDGKYGELYLFDTITITKALPEKYVDSDYDITAEEIDSYKRMPDFVYFLLYFSALGIFIVVCDRFTIKRYFNYKIPYLKQKFSKKKREDIGSTKSLIRKNLLSFTIFLALSIIFSIIFLLIDFIDQIIAIALAVAFSILIMIPINFKLINKSAALKTTSHLVFYLCVAGLVAFFLLTKSYLFYLYYLNFIILTGAFMLAKSANYLSKRIKPSKISGKNSFYLGGVLTVFGIFLFFLGAANLIAQF